MKTQLLLDHEPVADGGTLVRALLRITGDAPPETDRRPLDLALVLDRSGSMSGEKLERAKEAAALLVRRIGAKDVVSIVAYDDEVRTMAARVDGAHKQDLLDAVAAIETGGMTNLSGGWLRGRELVSAGIPAAAEMPDPAVDPEAAAPQPQPQPEPQPEPQPLSRILLLTDGLANTGITDPGQLRDLFATARANGITTTTIGFGADYDERLLAALAEAGGGGTYYIEKPDQAPAVFDVEMSGLLSLAAQNVAVTIRPGRDAQVTAVHHRYPRTEQKDGSLRLELGDLYALEPRSLLAEFLMGDVGAAEADVALLTVEGHVLLPGGGVEKRTVDLPIRVKPGDAPVANPEVRRELLVQQAARARDEALEARRRGDLEGGARALSVMADRVDAMAGDDADLADEAADLREMAVRYETEVVSEADAKYMQQRSIGSSLSRSESYRMLSEERAKRRGGKTGDAKTGRGKTHGSKTPPDSGEPGTTSGQ